MSKTVEVESGDIIRILIPDGKIKVLNCEREYTNGSIEIPVNDLMQSLISNDHGKSVRLYIPDPDQSYG